MKKILFIINFLFLFIPISCFASTNTYTRSKDKPLVPSDVIVSEENIQDILNTPAVYASEKIYDFADLYSFTEEDNLYSSLMNYSKSSGIDAAIVTTKSLNGYSIRDYAYHFYDYNDFQTDGIIFVISLEKEEPEVFMGNSGTQMSKVFSIYTDDIINQTLQYIYYDISIGKYYSATDEYIHILQGFYDSNDSTKKEMVYDDIPWIEIGVLASTLTFVLYMIFIFRIRNNNRIIFYDNLEHKLDNSTLMVKINLDDLFDTVIKK